MFPILLITFLIFAIAFIGMAIGVIVHRKTLKGTCGGLANMKDENGRSLCEACTDPSPECRGLSDANQRARGDDEKMRDADPTHSPPR